MLKYKFKETEKIKSLLVEIEALKIVFERIRNLPHIEENLRRESILKSSLFSARIEGNPLDLEGIKATSETRKTAEISKLEVFNLLSAYRYIYSKKAPKNLSLDLLKKLHQLTLKNLSVETGKFRRHPWAIFNQAGAAIYLAPSPFRLPKIIREFIQLSRKLKYAVPIKAAILQFLFEKIHPFADGNGRVGRLISAYVMNKGGYGFRGLVSIEEIIEKNRENYYQVLEPSKNATEFVEFFLMSFIEQAYLVLDKLSEKREELPEDFLLPRRRKILEIIRDHLHCSFDFISRRFPAVNPKTLHHDLKQLQEKGFIIKAGKTRGATYKARGRNSD